MHGMKRELLGVAFGCVYWAACGGVAQHDDVLQYTDEGAGETSSFERAETLVTLTSASQTVYFVARTPLEGEGVSVGIDIATETAFGAADDTRALLDDGATPLEIFRKFAAEDRVAPEELVLHHREAATLAGRELGLRDYARLSPIGAGVNIQVCKDFSTFQNYALSKTTAVNWLNLPVGGPGSVSTKGTSSSSKDIIAWGCNDYTWQGCWGWDRKQVDVYVAPSGGGGGVVWSKKLTDCQLLQYNWATTVKNATYGIVAGQGEVCPPWDEDSFRPEDSNNPVNTYYGIGREP